MTKGNLLLVDDDRQVLESMADWLRDQGMTKLSISTRPPIEFCGIGERRAKRYC